MKCFDLISNNRPSPHWAKLVLAGVMVAALAGCGGGSDGAPGATGATGAPGATGATGPAGANAVATVNAASLTPDQWASLRPAGQVTGVTIGSDGKPVVSFKVTDAAGNPIIGLGNTSKSATATLPGLTNMSFAFGKLMSRTDSSPSTWVSYIVTSVPTTTQATVIPQKPSTDNTGTLVDNKDGTYVYTFYRSIANVKTVVNDPATIAAAKTAAGANAANINVADLGDLTYDPTLTHRVGIHISGNAPGTGTNTPNAVQVVSAVPIKTATNLFYDFIPATGKPVTATDVQRELVNVNNCFGCHVKFTFHGGDAMSGVGGSRQDTKMCVLCHTDQRKYSVAEAPTTATGYSGTSTDRINGHSIKDMPVWIHKLHMGAELVKTGYNVNGIAINSIEFPQNLKNCTVCHSNAAQADNWKNVPSRLACGACHDGIDFSTGQGTTLAGSTLGHIGGAKADDKLCALCHDAPSITTYHVNSSPFATPVSPYANAAYVVDYNSANMPAGTINIAYDVKSLTLNSASNPVLTFRFLTNGGVAGAAPTTPVVFNAAPTTAPSAADITANNVVELMPNFVGSPDIFVTMAAPQDGIATPADFNMDVHTAAAVRMSVRNCWNKVSPATTCTMTGPNSSGYYALTVTGTTIPTTAVMVTGGLGMTEGYGTSASPLNQTNVSGYPVTVLKDGTGKVTGWQGGINVAAPTKTVTLSGALPAGFPTATTSPNQQIFATTARRAIVEKSRCESCHGSLGNFTSKTFHGGQFNDPTTCAVCHDPNLFDSGWQIASGAWVHEIHSSAKRAADVPKGGALFNIGVGPSWATLEYPGVLRDCLQCHLPGTVNFGNAANSTQAGFMTYRTALSGAYTVGPYTAPFGNITSKDYGARFAYNPATGATTDAAGTTLVNSPITNACFSCHTGTVAQNHMLQNGGVLYATRASVTVNGKAVPTEACLACHGAGRVADAEAVHLQTMQ